MKKYLIILLVFSLFFSCIRKKESEYVSVLKGISTATIDSAILYHDTDMLISLVKVDVTHKMYSLDKNNPLIKRFDSIMDLNGGKIYGNNTGIWIYSDYVFMIIDRIYNKCYYPPSDTTCYFQLTKEEQILFGSKPN